MVKPKQLTQNTNRMEKQQGVGMKLRGLSRNDWILFTVVLIIFFSTYRWGWHLIVVDRFIGLTGLNSSLDSLHDFFVSFQSDSDSFVIGRLEQNRIGGLFSEGGSLGIGGSYLSQVGLGGWLLTIPATVFGLYGSVGTEIMFSVTVFFNALLATIAILMIRRGLSTTAAVFVGIALLQPWPSAIAHSIYWQIGLKLLPSIALIWLFMAGKNTYIRVLAIGFALTSVVFLSGHEYSTVVVACQLAVIAYYAVRDSWSVRDSIKYIVTIGISAVLALMASLLLHYLQLYLRFQSEAQARDVIKSVISKRTAISDVSDPQYAASIASNPTQVLDTYLDMPVFGAPYQLPLVHYFTVTTLIALCVFAIIFSFKLVEPTLLSLRQNAFGAAWMISLLGPFGWFLLARPHSFDHVHLNFAIWFLPTVPLGLAILALPVQAGLSRLKENKLSTFIILLTIIFIAIFFLYSLATMK